jgi:hypothetical protein
MRRGASAPLSIPILGRDSAARLWVDLICGLALRNNPARHDAVVFMRLLQVLLRRRAWRT